MYYTITHSQQLRERPDLLAARAKLFHEASLMGIRLDDLRNLLQRFNADAANPAPLALINNIRQGAEEFDLLSQIDSTRGMGGVGPLGSLPP